MDLSDLIEVPAIMPALKANSKKQLLQLLAEKAASITGLPVTSLTTLRIGSSMPIHVIQIRSQLAAFSSVAAIRARTRRSSPV